MQSSSGSSAAALTMSTPRSLGFDSPPNTSGLPYTSRIDMASETSSAPQLRSCHPTRVPTTERRESHAIGMQASPKNGGHVLMPGGASR